MPPPPSDEAGEFFSDAEEPRGWSPGPDPSASGWYPPQESEPDLFTPRAPSIGDRPTWEPPAWEPRPPDPSPTGQGYAPPSQEASTTGQGYAPPSQEASTTGQGYAPPPQDASTTGQGYAPPPPDSAPPATGSWQAPATRRPGETTGTWIGRTQRLHGGSPSTESKMTSVQLGGKRLEGVTLSLALAIVLVVVSAGAALALRILPAAPSPTTPAVGEPFSSRWVCPLVPSAKAGGVTIANVGAQAARLRTTLMRGGSQTDLGEDSLPAGSSATKPVKSGTDGLLQVEAFGAPIAVAAAGQAPCEPGTGDRWWLADGDETHAQSTILLANPNSEDAAVSLILHTTQGPLAFNKLVLVPGRSSVRKRLLDLGNDQQLNLRNMGRFSVELFARQGRVVVAGMVQQGKAKAQTSVFVPGRREPRSEWLFPGAVGNEQLRTHVLITNPGNQPLSLEASAASSNGLVRPAGFDDVIQAGGFGDIELGVGSSGPFALRLRSRNGAPFLAAAVVQTLNSSTRVYVDPGGERQQRWVLPLASQKFDIVLANLSATPVTATVHGLGPSASALGQVQLRPGFVKPVSVAGSSGPVLVEAQGAGVLMFTTAQASVPASQVGGLPPGGPVVPGPAAAP